MISSKSDFVNITMEMFNPLKKHYSTNNARLILGHWGAFYDEDVIELEAWARPLWAFASYIKGGGSEPELEEIYLNGLIHGTDPSDDEYWGHSEDYDQRFVEMASIAYSLLIIPDKLWYPLTTGQKNNVVSWLSEINTHETQNCNWLFFTVLVNLALKKLGRPYDEEKMESFLQTLDSFYIGNGWYEDGYLKNKDYYIAFAFHFYGLLYSTFEPDSPYSIKFRNRAEIFGREFIYWFDDNGEALPYGRSLTYRFAQVAFFSACVYADVEPFSTSVMKGIICRHFDAWMNSPIKDNDGILTVGYKYNNLIMSENYNAPGSPYWCMKALVLLALPDNHEFWSAAAAPMPDLDTIKVLSSPLMILQRTTDNVVAAVSGIHSPTAEKMGHVVEKYSKFLYSTKFGFSVQKFNNNLDEMAPDSMLVFEVNDHFYVRYNVSNAEILGNSMVSQWSPLDGITVETKITFTNNGHTREHTVNSNVACKAYDCGFAVSTSEEAYGEAVTDNMARISTSKSICCVSGSQGKVIAASPNTNIVNPTASIPAVVYDIPQGISYITTQVQTTL